MKKHRMCYEVKHRNGSNKVKMRSVTMILIGVKLLIYVIKFVFLTNYEKYNVS